MPTILIDEGDTYPAENDGIRGIINGGHNRLTAFVWRSTGDDHEPTQFKVWSPKCIAMIGKLPDTLEDRALVIPLRRKQAGETVERFRADKLDEFLPLRRQAQRWADDNMMRLRGLDPDIPDVLNDRAQDNARSICAIADIAGGEWPQLTPDRLAVLKDGKAEVLQFLNSADEISDWSENPDADAFKERAAIAEYDGGLTRADAEDLAAQCQGYENVVAFRAARKGAGNG